MHAWGDSVATLGLLSGGSGWAINGADDRQWYTTTFGGTSSASPIVTGAAAVVQGFRKSNFLSPLTPLQMRDLLRGTGTAQATSTKGIGPLPNLRSVIAAHGGG